MNSRTDRLLAHAAWAQASDAKAENTLLKAKARRLQDMLVSSRPREEDLINTIAGLEQVRP